MSAHRDRILAAQEARRAAEGQTPHPMAAAEVYQRHAAALRSARAEWAAALRAAGVPTQRPRGMSRAAFRQGLSDALRRVGLQGDYCFVEPLRE